ncbi:MAG: DNA polymerase III subunit delta' [Cyanobacteriota bacterium]
MPDDPLFGDLEGHTLAVRLLRAGLESGRLAPAYLFAGPDGVGRRLAARRFLEGVLRGGSADPLVRRRLAEGNLADLLWLEPTYMHQGQAVPASQAEAQGVSQRTPPQIRLEQVREVTRFLGRRPSESPRPLVVIEAAEAMAEGAANALLKTLEEPGDGLLILISSAPERLLVTIRSRCQWIPFPPLTAAQMETVLIRGGEASPDPDGGARRDPEGLLALAGGSPGALLAHRRHWQRLPEGLADRLEHRSSNPLEALELAREISENLDGEQQLWLLSWWQTTLWRRERHPRPVARLEVLRKHLLGHVQPRLAWEVTLLDLARLRGG